MGLPYFPMYPTDFEAKTSHLTMMEDGAYNRLLRICWMTPGCSIPDDVDWIFRRLRATDGAEKEAVLSVLSEFFTIENGRYSNARLAREWVTANDAHQKRVLAGSKGGKAKALQTNKTEPSNAKAKPKQPEPEPEPEPYIKEDTNVSSQKTPQRRKCKIPENAILSDSQLKSAEKRGLSLQEAEAQFDRFKNNALAKGLTYLDWDRAFITWLDSPYFKAITKGNGNDGFDFTAGNGPRNRVDPALENIARLAGLGKT